jgi:hypothetical protein
MALNIIRGQQTKQNEMRAAYIKLGEWGMQIDWKEPNT